MGRVFGFNTETLLVAASVVQQLINLLTILEGGKLGKDAANFGNPVSGPPHGDDQLDQAWIMEGANDFDSGYWSARCQWGSQ